MKNINVIKPGKIIFVLLLERKVCGASHQFMRTYLLFLLKYFQSLDLYFKCICGAAAMVV